jgi:hypothetical protein
MGLTWSSSIRDQKREQTLRRAELNCGGEVPIPRQFWTQRKPFGNPVEQNDGF